MVTHSAPYILDHTGSVDSGLIAILGYFTHTEIASTPSILLPQFDPSLGRLSAVTVTLASTGSTFAVQSTGLLSLISGGQLTRNFAYDVTAGTSNGGSSTELVSSGSTLLTLLGLGGGDIGGLPAPGSRQFLSVVDQANFSGTGTVAVKLTATNKLEIFTVLSLFNGAGIVGAGQYAGLVTISYDYVPWTLSGRVYHDIDHNGVRSMGESGTGLPLFAKLVRDDLPGGPASGVVAVDPTSGLYTLNASLGTYNVFVDDNASATDITPLVPPAGWTGTQPSTFIRKAVVRANTADHDFGLIHATRACGRLFVDNGAVAGVANDGIMNGGETGVARQTVRLTDANNSSLDTAASDDTGSYCLFIASTISNSAALTIRHDRHPSFMATGGSAGNSSGAYLRGLDAIAFNYVFPQAYDNLNFGTVPAPLLAGSTDQSDSPDAVLWFSHRFESGSMGQVTFSVSHTSSPAGIQLPAAIYHDINGNARIDPGEPLISSAMPVTSGQSVPLLLKVTLPFAAAAGTKFQIALRAEVDFSNASPSLTYVATANDNAEVLPMNAGALHLSKVVDKTTATPGTIILYTITFTNTGEESIRNLLINDNTPPYTVFATSTVVKLPGGLGAPSLTTPAVGTGGAIQWSFTGELLPGADGGVQFSVVVDP